MYKSSPDAQIGGTMKTPTPLMYKLFESVMGMMKQKEQNVLIFEPKVSPFSCQPLPSP